MRAESRAPGGTQGGYRARRRRRRGRQVTGGGAEAPRLSTDSGEWGPPCSIRTAPDHSQDLSL